MITRVAQDCTSAPYIPDANPGLLQPYRKHEALAYLQEKTIWECVAAVCFFHWVSPSPLCYIWQDGWKTQVRAAANSRVPHGTGAIVQLEAF